MVHLGRRGEQMLDKLSYAHREQLRRIGPRLSALLKQLSAENM
jgi:hypothetical protein